MHTYTHTHTHMHICTHTHTHAHMHTYAHTCTYAHIRTHAYTRSVGRRDLGVRTPPVWKPRVPPGRIRVGLLIPYSYLEAFCPSALVCQIFHWGAQIQRGKLLIPAGQQEINRCAILASSPYFSVNLLLHNLRLCNNKLAEK